MEDNKIFDSLRKRGNKRILVMGDFNYANIDWSELEAGGGNEEVFLDLINDLFLTQHVKQATRGNNILDLVLCSEIGMVSDLEVQCPVANCDHNRVVWTVLSDKGNTTANSLVIYDFNRRKYKEIMADLDSISWNELFTDLEVNEKWDKFANIMRLERNKFIPTKKERNRSTVDDR